MEGKYVFRNELKEGYLEVSIRKLLETHNLLNVMEFCRNTGLSDGLIRAILETMIERREVERLRPLNYENDDMDFFRLSGPQKQIRDGKSRGRWLSGLKRAARLLFDDMEDHHEHRHLNNILTTS